MFLQAFKRLRHWLRHTWISRIDWSEDGTRIAACRFLPNGK